MKFILGYPSLSPSICASFHLILPCRSAANLEGRAMASSKLIHLDGTTLEGGGQLLRLAISLSSLTHLPIKITDIRGKRGPISSPGKDGGLKPAHLAAVTWLAKATGAETEGMEAKSRELTFRPSAFDTRPQGVWKDIREESKIIRRTCHISLSTPGSVSLILQAVLPYILFGLSAFPEEQATPIPLRVSIDGGTNVSNSPSFDYVCQVLLPTLSLKLGIPEITTTLHKRGWSTGGTQIGSVTFDILPFPKRHVLPAFHFSKRGRLAKVRVSVLAPGAKAKRVIREDVIKQLLALEPELEIVFPVDEDSRNEKRWYLLLVAETSEGYRLGRDWLYDRKTKGIKIEETCVQLVSKVIKDLKRELDHGGCVDEYMQDQLVIFQALADGQAAVDAGRQQASLHTETARWVAERVLGVRFNDNGNCEGVQFRVGEDCSRQTEEVVEGVRELKI